MNTLLRSARLGRNAAPYDVLVSAGRVARVRESITAEPGWEVVDLDGRFVLPGLWDHHVHFDQWTLARERVDLSGAESAAATARLVAERLRTRPPEGSCRWWATASATRCGPTAPIATCWTPPPPTSRTFPSC
ncbi:amidohydrolase family protein [Nonomuraea recticatena]|uniref:amidohydrolase family protein n=1 Tax=Nonomuraea recticatena TaxID=46178 RepID=UPI00361DC2A6